MIGGRRVADVGEGNTVEYYVVAVLVLSTAEYARGLEEKVDFEFDKAISDRFGGTVMFV